MSIISDKVSYLKGLADGLNVDDSTNEGKLLLLILDALSDIASELDDNRDVLDDVEEQVNNLQRDLEEVEDLVFDDNCYDCGCGGDCNCNDQCDCDDTPDISYITVECPHCKKNTSFDVNIFNKDTEYVECPNCNKKIAVVYEDDNENCDCNCKE